MVIAKIHRRQLEVARDIAEQIKDGSTAISGVMAESFLVEGTQKWFLTNR